MLLARLLFHLIFASTKALHKNMPSPPPTPSPQNKSFPQENVSLTSSTVKGTSHLEGFPAGGPAPSWEEWVQALARGEVSLGNKLDQ